jgi:hypothetical protein
MLREAGGLPQCRPRRRRPPNCWIGHGGGLGPQGLVSIMGNQNFGESLSIRRSQERVILTILYLARMAIVDVATFLTAPPRDPVDRISIFVPGRGKHGLIAEPGTQAIMCTFRLFIDVRLLENRGVEAQLSTPG